MRSKGIPHRVFYLRWFERFASSFFSYVGLTSPSQSIFYLPFRRSRVGNSTLVNYIVSASSVGRGDMRGGGGTPAAARFIL